MKVFITGATGFVGQEVLRQASEAGHAVRILVRNQGSSSVQQLASKTNAQVHPGDLLQPGTIQNSLQGMDAVIHLVGIISESGRSTFENVHTESTRNLVTAAGRSGVKRFIHMSALGTRPGAVSRYHQTKWVAEEIVRQSGLAYTIFRPSLIYGPRDHFANLFADISRFSPILPVMGPGQARFQPIAVDVVARAFVHALDETRSIGQTFDLCGPERMAFPELLDHILKVTGRKRWKWRIPLRLARWQAAAMEFVFGRLLRKPPPLNRDQLIMLQEDNIGEGGKAEALFRLKQVPFEEGISAYLKAAK